MFLRKGDKVLVTVGKDRGKTGVIVKALPGAGRLVVDGINVLKKHLKPTPKHPHGGIVELFGPVDSSNVALICPSCSKITRRKYQLTQNGKVRVCAKCKAGIESKGKAKK